MADSDDFISFCLDIVGVSRNSIIPPMNSHSGAAPLRNQPDVRTRVKEKPSKTASAHFCENRITLSNVLLD